LDTKIDDLKKKIADLEKEIDKVKGKEKKPIPLKKKKIVPTKNFYTWKSPARVFSKKNKVWFLKIALISLLMILFFAILQDFMMILVICVGVLLVFLLASVPPKEAKHIITNKGIKSLGQSFLWEDMKEFWISIKEKRIVLYIQMKEKFPSRLVLILNNEREEKKVADIIGNYLEYKEYEKKQGWLTKRADGVMQDPRKYLK